MKKVIFFILLFMAFCLCTYANSCPYSPDGKHLYMNYTSKVHTPSGHSYYKECMECGHTVHEYYRILSDCCLCSGHSMTNWSTPGIAHTELGHLIQRQCTRCGYVNNNYVYDHSCCQCTGNHNYRYMISSVHTVSGHENYKECKVCAYRESTGFSSHSECCLCGNHIYTSWSSPTSYHYNEGHLQSRNCTKCSFTQNRHISNPDCCKCTGIHNYEVISLGSVHTAYGHLKTEKCTGCGHERTSYVSYIGCCQCNGHSYTPFGPLGPHSASGHPRTRVCSVCNITDSQFIKDDNCCLCYGHDFGSFGVPGKHTSLGHIQYSQCRKCDETQHRYINDFNCTLCSDTPTDTEEYHRWLMSKGIPSHSVSGRYGANYDTFLKYELIVYGGAASVPQNEFKQGEYRYLGYTYLEDIFTNMLFPNDVESGIPPEQWEFCNVSGALESWDSIEQTVQKPYMLSIILLGHGSSTLTAGQIGMGKAKVQTGASWSGAGSIYTEKPGGFYATFIVPSMGMGVLEASMICSPESLVFNISKEFEEIELTITGSVNKPSNEVKYIRAKFEGETESALIKSNTISLSKRIQIAKPSEFPKEYVFKGIIEAESIFGDKLYKEVYCTITVTHENIYIPPQTPPGGEDENPENPPTPPENTLIDILQVEIRGSLNHWEGHSHRFLSLEKVYVYVKAAGNIDTITVRFSPELESMLYTNSLGHTYDYSNDFFGKYVRFPQDSTIINYSQDQIVDFYWEYNLPLCPQTMDWDNHRIKPPYTMTVYVYGGNETKTLTISDIEVTGNIYQLLHPQPIAP